MLQRAYSTLEIKSSSDASGKRRFTGVASTIAVDRMQDIVVPRGMQAKLPVALLWQHDAHEPIGWVKATRVSDTQIEVDCEVAAVSETGSLQERLDTAWQSITSSLVRGLSIGFRPLPGGSEPIAGGGVRWTAWELLEISCVAIPANQDCGITQIRSIDQAMRRTVSCAGRVDRADASEDEMREAEAKFERAFAANDHEAMKAILMSGAFNKVIAQQAAKRAEELVRGCPDGTAAHLARAWLAICTESELRAAITKLQRCRFAALTARIDRQAQQQSALAKRLAALEKKGQ